jgi:protein TonB
LGLHAAALAYPVSFSARQEAPLMHVSIIPADQDAGAAGAPASTENRAPRGGPKAPAAPAQVSAPPEIHREFASHPEPQATGTESPERLTQNNFDIASTPASSSETAGSAGSTLTSIDRGAFGSGARATDGGGNGSQLSGTSSGSGGGNAEAGLGNKSLLSQARYRDTPRPDYPESARREGREGRVLLRVLVDHQGRSKQVEINSSSGSEALDRAAAEAIRRWRFHPARHGDQPVESWLRIPIEFRLADAASR